VLLRSIRRWPLGLGLLLTAALLIASSGTSRASGAPDAAQLLKAALSDATAAGSVHEVVRVTEGSGRAIFLDDVATGSGRQDITVTPGIRAHVRVVDRTAYISGNKTALVKYFGFSSSAATAVGDRWASIPSTSGDYASVADDAILQSSLADITPRGHLTELPATRVDGAAVIGIRGALPPATGGTGELTLYITRSSRPLPVSAMFTATESGVPFTSRSDLSDWGEHLALKPPTISVAVGGTS
jgi:hypothetical protein